MDDLPPVGLLQSAAAVLLARYALHRDPCVAAALERAFDRLAAHPALGADPAVAGGYRALALAWREMLGLEPAGRARQH